MPENRKPDSERSGVFGSEHLDEALDNFRKGLNALGKFCAEEALPVAEKTLKEGLNALQGLAKEMHEAVDEAIKKAREEFGSDNNDADKGDKD